MTATTVLSWRDLPAAQQPVWTNQAALEAAVRELKARAPLVTIAGTDALTARLGMVAAGKAFVLQAGDCAEPFGATRQSIVARIKLYLQMNVVLMYGAGVPVVKIGRIGGQYAKPRSADTETIGGETLPVYRGPIINGAKFTQDARTPDPARMLLAYDHAVETLKFLEELTVGGFADLAQVHMWDAEFVKDTPQGERYELLASEIDRALAFVRACSQELADSQALRVAEFSVSHEGLLLDYEAALTRRDAASGQLYDLSAHMLWIGERTRQIDGAHVAFYGQTANPIGVKLGPTATASQALELCEVLNSRNIPGRLSFITRMGANQVLTVLPPIVHAVQAAGHQVVWICDPMHGNTVSMGGFKTRQFDTVIREIEGFFAVCREANVWPGGVHLELTGDDVTECLGGGDPVQEHDLSTNYTTLCDPRLNAQQALDLAFLVAKLLQEG